MGSQGNGGKCSWELASIPLPAANYTKAGGATLLLHCYTLSIETTGFGLVGKVLSLIKTMPILLDYTFLTCV